MWKYRQPTKSNKRIKEKIELFADKECPREI